MKKTRILIAKFLLCLSILSIGTLFFNIQPAKAATVIDVPDRTQDTASKLANDSVKGCGEGSVVDAIKGGIGSLVESILICPLIRMINRGIIKLTIGDGEAESPLISFLKLPPLKIEDAAGNPEPLTVLVGGVVNIANAVYVIVFLFLIFASALPFNIDNYTIKKTLPKLIIAVILTQFSVAICAALIDFFNILGLIIPNILLALTQIQINTPAATSSAASGVSNLTGGLAGGSVIVGGVGTVMIAGVAGGAGIGGAFASLGPVLFLILVIVALVGLFMAMLYMLIRYFLLYALVLISPIAFVAWVIPGTSKFFSQWWKTFIKLNGVFTVIMALMASSIVLAYALGSAEKSFIPSLLPIIAVLMIPKALKAATKGMDALTAGVLGFVGGKASALAGKGTKAAGAKIKQGAGELGRTAQAKGAEAAFGRGKANLGTAMMGKFPSSKGKLEARQAVSARAEEKAKVSQAGLKVAGNPLQGLDLTKSDAELREQLSSRGYRGGGLDKMMDNIGKSKESLINSGVPAGKIKSGAQLYEHELQQIAMGQSSDLLGGISGKDEVNQLAAVSELSTLGSYGSIYSAMNTKGSSLTQDKMMRGVGSNIGDVMTKAPDLVKGAGPAFDSISAEKFVQLDKDSIKRLVAHAQSSEGGNARTNLANIAAEFSKPGSNLSSRLDPQSREELNVSGLGVKF